MYHKSAYLLHHRWIFLRTAATELELPATGRLVWPDSLTATHKALPDHASALRKTVLLGMDKAPKQSKTCSTQKSSEPKPLAICLPVYHSIVVFTIVYLSLLISWSPYSKINESLSIHSWYCSSVILTLPIISVTHGVVLGMPVIFQHQETVIFQHQDSVIFQHQKTVIFQHNSEKSTTEFSPPPRFCAT